ncbi:hypothetical protein ACHAXA_009999 [Cyclostephanos tholiformis]|uniref:Uncharacterized protein n=1 Tax=Cyclostephanos tholiformis TaxID=382380 RepID=A0ABD3RT26_9STRA
MSGKSDQRWLRNFVKWTTSRRGGRSNASGERSSTVQLSPSPSSPLPKHWVSHQRVQYQKLQRGEKSLMTRDRVALLEGADFVWKVRNKSGILVDDVENNLQSSDIRRASATTHATGGGEERKDESIGERTKSVPVIRSAGEPGRSIINNGPPVRKSPRKSPPTQFYHSILGNRSVSGDGASGGWSSVPTISTSDSASPTATLMKRQRPTSPSKRISQSSLGDSLRLLPTDVVAKDESDNRGDKKKKVRRGRRSTSSLLALEALAGSSMKERDVDSVGKCLVSLSHRELNEVLSKNRKKQPRKKSVDGTSKKKMRDEPTTTIVGAATNDANKARFEDSKLVDDSSKGELDVMIGVSIGGHDASQQSPESPIRITRLLPALMDGDSANGTSRATAVSDLTGKSAADAPSIAQLLLSCLSEDSEEKAAHLTSTRPKSTTDEASSLAGISCEMNCDDRGGSSSLPSHSKSSEEYSLRLHSPPDTSGSGAQVESSTSNLKQNLNARPKASMTSSMEEFLVPHTSVELSIQKEKTNEVDPSNKKEAPVASSLQRTLSKENPEMKELNPDNTTLARGGETSLRKQRVSMYDKSTETTFEDTAIAPKETPEIKPSQKQEVPVGSLAHCTIWTCDICKSATFEDYFDAVTHEDKCAITNKVQQAQLINKEAEEESNTSRVRVRCESPPVETEKYQSTSVPKIGTENMQTNEVEPSDKNEAPVASSLQRTLSKENPEMKELNPDNTALARGGETSLRKQREPVGHLATSTFSMRDKSTEATFEDTAIAPKETPEIKPSQKQEVPVGSLAHCTIWTCDICKTATFEDYFDAVTHEDKCAIDKKVQQAQLISKEAEEESNTSRVRVRSKSPPVETEKYQSTSVPKIGMENMPSPTLFSPLSLMSPNRGNDLALQITKNMNIVQNKMTEFGRLQMEAHFVAQRMREIEEMIKLGSKTISNIGDIEGCRTNLKKRSYRATSKSTSIQHHKRSWSRYNESSDDYSDEYHSQRRQKNSPDEFEPKMLSGKHSSRRLEIRNRSSATTKGHSTSSRIVGALTQLKYDVSEIDMRSSQKSKKVERYHADRTVSPKKHYRHVDEMHFTPRTKKSGEMYNAPIDRMRLKGHNTEPLVVGMPLTSGSKKANSKQVRINQDFGSNAEKPNPSPASDQSDEYSREDCRSRTIGPTLGKLLKQNEGKSERPPKKTSTKPDVEADAGYSEKRSSTQSPGEAKIKGNIPPAASTQYEANKTRDPVYWLAGVESSSDDESWDFDGPMILPPPPL